MQSRLVLWLTDFIHFIDGFPDYKSSRPWQSTTQGVNRMALVAWHVFPSPGRADVCYVQDEWMTWQEMKNKNGYRYDSITRCRTPWHEQQLEGLLLSYNLTTSQGTASATPATSDAMPASTGRTRMPHNNRMSIDASLRTTAIWSQTIGHDPHAAAAAAAAPTAEQVAAGQRARDAVLAVARQQNLTGGANRDDFALRMYQGLKPGKKAAVTAAGAAGAGGADEAKQLALALQEDPLSSSEDELVAVKVKKSKKKRHRKNRKHKRRDSSSSSSDDDDDDDDSGSDTSSERRRREKKRRHRKRSKKHHSRDCDDVQDTASEDSYDRRRKHKSKDRRKRTKKRRRRLSSSSDDSDSSRQSSKNEHHKKRSQKHSSGQNEEDMPTYVASESYSGSKKGYVFRAGDMGIGYYIDRKPKVNQKELEEITRWHSG